MAAMLRRPPVRCSPPLRRLLAPLATILAVHLCCLVVSAFPLRRAAVADASSASAFVPIAKSNLRHIIGGNTLTYPCQSCLASSRRERRGRMDEELEQIRRLRRERWLASTSGTSSGAASGAPADNGDDRRSEQETSAAVAAGGEASSRNAAAEVSATSAAASSFAASSDSSNVNAAHSRASNGSDNKKRARSATTAAARAADAKVVDLTSLDSDDPNSDSDVDRLIFGPKDQYESDGKKNAGGAKYDNGDDSDSSSIIEIISPPRKKSNNSKAPKKQGTEQQHASSNSGPIGDFAVATYNVWFGPPHQNSRMQAISSILSELQPRPLMVGLQEVTAGLSSILYPLLHSMGYEIVTQPSGGQYYVAIAVLTGSCGNVLGSAGISTSDRTDTVSAQLVSSGFEPYGDTIMDRGLLWVHVRLTSTSSSSRAVASSSSSVHSKEVLFTTTHLESFMRGYPTTGSTYDGVAQRARQVREAVGFCTNCATERSRHGTHINSAFITGDLNWDDGRKRSSGNDQRLLDIIASGGGTNWTDAWIECRPGEEGYTYDAKKNDMLRGNLRRRFDRCLVWNNETRGRRSSPISPVQCDSIGTEVIAGLTYRKEKQKWAGGGTFVSSGEYTELPVSPSDHFGLQVRLGCRQ